MLSQVHSKWLAKPERVELTVVKAERGRWLELFASPYDGKVKIDWAKYKDPDEELDEEEQKSGLRGPPVRESGRRAGERTHSRRTPVQVVGNPGLAKAVDDYWQRKRAERMQSGELPDLEAVSKLAEAEHAQKGGDFDAIVQRLWADAKRSFEVQRAMDAREDAWAQHDEV